MTTSVVTYIGLPSFPESGAALHSFILGNSAGQPANQSASAIAWTHMHPAKVSGLLQELSTGRIRYYMCGVSLRKLSILSFDSDQWRLPAMQLGIAFASEVFLAGLHLFRVAVPDSNIYPMPNGYLAASSGAVFGLGLHRLSLWVNVSKSQPTRVAEELTWI
jgi:hypothetical protein